MKKILIVEDDYVSRIVLSKVFASHGQCDVVCDGLQAIDAFVMASNLNQPYDLICLDIMLPKLDGVRVLKAVRELEYTQKIEKANQVKIFMTTALGESKMVQDAIENGCDAYFGKPIDILELNKTLKKYDCC